MGHMPLLHACRCLSGWKQQLWVSEWVSSHLVHKGADKVDEAALQLWKFLRFVPVHHGLKERERERERADGLIITVASHTCETPIVSSSASANDVYPPAELSAVSSSRFPL